MLIICWVNLMGSSLGRYSNYTRWSPLLMTISINDRFTRILTKINIHLETCIIKPLVLAIPSANGIIKLQIHRASASGIVTLSSLHSKIWWIELQAAETLELVTRHGSTRVYRVEHKLTKFHIKSVQYYVKS